MNKITILEIIPIEPLSHNSPDTFLYFSTEPVERGSIVKITLKNIKTYGYVYNTKFIEDIKIILKDLEFELKPIEGIYKQKRFISSIQENFAEWIAKNYYLSLAHSFYFFLSFFNKIENDIEAKEERGHKFLKKYESEFNINNLQNLPILIITPTEDYAKIIYEKLDEKYKNNVVYLDLEKPKRHFKEFVNLILNKEMKIFIGSKNSIFLPWQKLNQIIVLEEGNIFYKEFFKSPYFNYLNLIEKLAKLLKTELILIDKIPSLKTFFDFTLSYKNLKEIEVKKFDSIFELEKIIKDYKTIRVFTPLKILSKKIRCNACFYEFLCPKCNFPLSVYENSAYCRICFKKYSFQDKCPNCNSNDIYIKGIGAIWLKRFLEKNGYFVWFIKNKKEIKEFLSHNFERFIILGSYNILNPFLPNTEISIFINFDQAFYSWNPFLKERYIRIIYKLSEFSPIVYLHTNKNIEFIEKIKNFSIINEILEERRINKLPPFYRLVKLISRLKKLEELNKRLLEIKREIEKRILLSKEYAEISGPFLERIPLRKRRYQMFLLIRSKNEINLKKLLSDIPYIEEIKADEEDI